MAVSGEASDLLVDVIITLGHVERAADAHGRVVQVARPNLGHVAGAVHLLIFRPVLVVVVCLEKKKKY